MLQTLTGFSACREGHLTPISSLGPNSAPRQIWRASWPVKPEGMFAGNPTQTRTHAKDRGGHEYKSGRAGVPVAAAAGSLFLRQIGSVSPAHLVNQAAGHSGGAGCIVAWDRASQRDSWCWCCLCVGPRCSLPPRYLRKHNRLNGSKLKRMRNNKTAAN